MKKRLLTGILLTLGCLSCSIWLAGFFVPAGPVRLVAGMLGVIPLVPSFAAHVSRHGQLKRRKQCAFLFQVLLSRVSVGDTPEIAFAVAAVETGAIFGDRSGIVKALKDLDSDLSNHTSFGNAMSRFAVKLGCEEAEVVLRAVSSSRLIGAGMETLLRTGRDMISEHLAAEAEVESETAQRRAEAMVMMVLPFFVSVMVQTLSQDYLATTFSGDGAALFMALIYLAVSFSAGIALRMLAGTHKAAKSARSGKRPRPSKARQKNTFIGHAIQTRLPAMYRMRLQQAFWFTMPGTDIESALSAHMARKMALLLVGLLAGTAITFVQADLWQGIPLLAVLLPVAHDHDLHKRADRARQGMLLDFPIFLEVMTSVLHAGLSLGSALDVCSGSLRHPDRWLGVQIGELRSGLRTGRPISTGLDRMSARVDIPDIQASLSLLAQCERAGGKELISMLHMQIACCRLLRRNAMRKQMERKSMLLMIPMTMNLVIILILAGLPAYLSLSS